jgi:hypothetical protein
MGLPKNQGIKNQACPLAVDKMLFSRRTYTTFGYPRFFGETIAVKAI